MKKIMFYINAIHHGGAERVMVNLTSQLCEKGYDVILVTSFKSQWEYALNCKVKRIVLASESSGSFIKKNFTWTMSLRKVIVSEKPDVIVSFMAEPNFRALLATIGTKTKNIISVRNDPDREYPTRLYKFLAKTLYLTAEHIVFQTNDAQCWFSKKIRMKSSVILNQVDEKFFSKELIPYSKRNGIYTTGRLTKQKNQKLLIDAFYKIADNVSDDLYIYGEGELRERLQSYIYELGLENRVHLLGASKNVEEDIKAARVFVLSSDFEGCPNSLMEALALGIPSVSTDCPCGGPRMLSKLNGCVLVPCNDVDVLSNSIYNVATDMHYSEMLSHNAKKTSELFKSDKVILDWKRCIDSV